MMLKHKIRTSLYHPVPHRKRCCSVPQPITRQLLVANTARGVNKRSSRSLHPSSSSSTDLPPKAFLGIPTSSLANLCIRLLTIHGIHRFYRLALPRTHGWRWGIPKMQTRVVSARKKRTDAEPLFLTFLFYGRKKIKWAVVDRGYGAQASSNSTLRAKAAADNAAVTECLRSEVDEKNSHAHAMTLNKPVQQKSQVTAIFLSSKGGIFQNALRTRRKMRKKKKSQRGNSLSLSRLFSFRDCR